VLQAKGITKVEDHLQGSGDTALPGIARPNRQESFMFSASNSLALLTDMYQLTMANGYWKQGKANQLATFHLYFRKSPFAGGYTIAAGLADAIDFLANWHFSDDDLTYLASIPGNDGKPIFEAGFLDYLRHQTFDCDVDAIPEGTVVFPNQPLLRITGSMLQCQIVETPLLNILNFQSLIATKAARICRAAKDEAVLEFGLRRAQGPDGGLSASRAAYIGGCSATSNLLAGKKFNIPVKGTHAHSWVMSFQDELESFEEYAKAMPNNCIFLVDTYNTVEGVKHAITVGKQLKAAGHRLVGVRLDSGDLAHLSIQARTLLDQAGFQDAVIVASNDLDEYTIESLKQQDAKISVWGVGTRLATAYDQPALGGVYKLGAIQDANGRWEPKLKLSEQTIKVSNPGKLNVRRFFDGGSAVADVIFNELDSNQVDVMVDPMDHLRRRKINPDWNSEDLLLPYLRNGKLTEVAKSFDHTNLEAIRSRSKNQLALFHDGIKRFQNPHQYPVGLEQSLYELKSRMVLAARGF